ncbi:alpha/beta fold hydrolase [Streptomyces sp. NPDC016675]|uniref:alpha/beta fold hydrolase n=1 Tax=Streptomyces sp. NPDC016675 TaxID=3364970 RepID=UPI003701C429
MKHTHRPRISRTHTITVPQGPAVAGYAAALTSPLRTLRMYAAPSQGEESPFEVRDELPVLTPPALVLAGRHDFIYGPRWADPLHVGLEEAELTVLEEAGYLAHLEQPAQFDAYVLAFLHAQGVVRGPRNS